MLRDNDKITTPYNVQVTITGDIITMSTSSDITTIIKSAHWLGVPIRNIFRVLVFSPNPSNIDISPLIPVIGYMDDRPVIQPLVIGRYTSMSEMLWVDMGVDFSVVKDHNGHVNIDFGHLIFTDDPTIYDDTVQVIGNINTTNRKVTNISCNGSVITTRYQPSRMDSMVEYGSTHLPYQTGWCNAIRCGQYTFTTSFGPYDINGKAISYKDPNDIIDKCINNVILSVKSFNLDNPIRLLVFIPNNMDKKQVMGVISRRFKDDSPVVECVISDTIQISGFYYQPSSISDQSPS